MKSHRTHIILLSLVAVSPIFLLAAGEEQTSIRPDPQASNAELRMSIIATTPQKAKGIQVFRVTLENVGDKDAVLNLGIMLANGKVLLPDAIHLILIDSRGKSRELHFSDRRYPGIAGRVDDYIIPLRTGSTHTFKLSLDDFWCPKTKEFRLKLKPGVYRVRSELTGKGAHFVNLRQR